MKSRIYLAILMALPALASAENLELDTVEVKASRLDAEIQNQNAAIAAGDTTELIREIYGIQLRRAGGVSSLPMIQGLADDRIRIKVDGMDLISSCANHMNPALSYIAPANVSHIKVYSGITPVSVGGDSLAGSIVVNSASPQFATGDELLTQATFNTFYRSNNDAFGVNASASVANQQVYFRYTGATVNADNAHAGASFKAAGIAATGRGSLEGDEIGSTYFHSTNHAFALGLHQENNLLEFKLGLQDIDKQGFPNQRMDMTGNKSEQFQVRYVGEFNWGKWESRVYHENTRHKMNFGEDKQFYYGNAPGMPMNTDGHTTGINTQFEIPLNERDTLRTGLDIQRYHLNDYWPPSGTGAMMAPNVFQNIRNGQRDRYDLYAEWDAKWDAQWWTQAGMRLSQVNTSADTVSGYSAMYTAAATRFNAGKRDASDVNVDATLMSKFTPDTVQDYAFGYALKTRSPNLYERYAWSNSNTMVMNMNNWIGDGNGYVGNVNLNPEKAHTLQLEANWHDAEKRDWQIKFTPYFRYVDDYIDATSCASVGLTCSTRTDGFSNLSLSNQSARMVGFDLHTQKSLGLAPEWGSLETLFDVNYVRGRNASRDDNLYGLMPLNAKLTLQHRYGGWSNRVQARFVENKDNVSSIRNEIKTPGYSLLDLYSSYEWKSVKLDVGIENVFDKFYFDPTGGAYLGQGATMGTGVARGLQVPGVGRSVNMAITLVY
jgi:iron complex outermembrane recepter protein